MTDAPDTPPPLAYSAEYDRGDFGAFVVGAIAFGLLVWRMGEVVATAMSVGYALFFNPGGGFTFSIVALFLAAEAMRVGVLVAVILLARPIARAARLSTPWPAGVRVDLAAAALVGAVGVIYAATAVADLAVVLLDFLVRRPAGGNGNYQVYTQIGPSGWPALVRPLAQVAVGLLLAANARRLVRLLRFARGGGTGRDLA